VCGGREQELFIKLMNTFTVVFLFHQTLLSGHCRLSVNENVGIDMDNSSTVQPAMFHLHLRPFFHHSILDSQITRSTAGPIHGSHRGQRRKGL